MVVLLLLLLSATLRTSAVTCAEGPLPKFRVFVGHRVDLDLTFRTVVSLSGFGLSRITLVDTSSNLEAINDHALAALGVRLVEARGVAYFTGFVEFVRRTAIAEELDAFFWVHSDVDIGVEGVARGLASLCAVHHSGVRWGALLFSWDLYSAFSVPAVAATGRWDSGK